MTIQTPDPSAWPTSTPETQGVDSDQLVQIVQTIAWDRLPAHSLLILALMFTDGSSAGMLDEATGLGKTPLEGAIRDR